jgi:hypothetical protein
MRPKIRARVRVGIEYASRLEAEFAAELQWWKESGQIQIWRYEPIVLRLGPGLTYRPDFWVVWKDGSVGFVEVKGWMRDDARVKLLTAAEQYPEFRFLLATKPGGKRGQWVLTEINGNGHAEG